MSLHRNTISILGNVGRTPELRGTKSNTPVTNIEICTEHPYKTREGEKKVEKTWHHVVIFGRLAETVVKAVEQGQLVSVDGRVRNQEFMAKDGTKHNTIEIVCEKIGFGPKSKWEYYDDETEEVTEGEPAKEE